MRRSFSNPRHEVQRRALLEWHQSLEHDKGSRARLRRTATPDEVAFEPTFHRLLARLRPVFQIDDTSVRRNLAAVAGLAARVREHTAGMSLARQMGTSAGKSSRGPAVSEHRFRRLLTTARLEERYAQLSRVIHLLGNKVDLMSVADAMCDWDDDPDLRQHWAYEYYQAASPDIAPRKS
jgi:CRISPR system Cascade subunit CasB